MLMNPFFLRGESVVVSSQTPNGCNSPIGPCGQKIKTKKHMVKMFVDLIVLLAASRR